MDIGERFEKYSCEHSKFDRVENKRSTRPDLHAFIVLNEIFPSTSDIVAASQHDQIYLGVDEDCLDSLTDDQIVEIVRCGVFYDEEGLSMYT